MVHGVYSNSINMQPCCVETVRTLRSWAATGVDWSRPRHTLVGCGPCWRVRSAVEFEYVCAVWRVFGIEAGGVRTVVCALGLLHSLARRPDGRDLLLLRRQRAEGFGDQVRVRRDHVLPACCVHHICCVTAVMRKYK